KGARFHPKTILLSSNNQKSPTILVTGSSNLTRLGLTRNGEGVLIASSESSHETLRFQELAKNIWSTGHTPTASEIEKYTQNYKKRKKSARPTRKPTKNREILKDDDSEKDPSLSNTCWIELGKNTALGRELEFKSEQALFFTENPHDKKDVEINFQISNGSIVPQWLKYRHDNAMWRLQLKPDIPEVKRGLRPTINGKLGRSPFAAVFTRTRTSGVFKLRFINVKSAKYQAIRAHSLNLGTMGRTSSREYGWY
ncbi:MAG: hypothetical protein AB1798_24310, partial [Spirochaetota bacterium]